jgi:hypothetical protein
MAPVTDGLSDEPKATTGWDVDTAGHVDSESIPDELSEPAWTRPGD